MMNGVQLHATRKQDKMSVQSRKHTIIKILQNRYAEAECYSAIGSRNGHLGQLLASFQTLFVRNGKFYFEYNIFQPFQISERPILQEQRLFTIDGSVVSLTIRLHGSTDSIIFDSVSESYANCGPTMAKLLEVTLSLLKHKALEEPIYFAPEMFDILDDYATSQPSCRLRMKSDDCLDLWVDPRSGNLLRIGTDIALLEDPLAAEALDVMAGVAPQLAASAKSCVLNPLRLFNISETNGTSSLG